MIVAATLLPTGNPPTNTILTDRLADPLPDAGLTCSHGWFDAAVHDTVPAPALRQPHDLRRRLRHERRACGHRTKAQRRLVERQSWVALPIA